MFDTIFDICKLWQDWNLFFFIDEAGISLLGGWFYINLDYRQLVFYTNYASSICFSLNFFSFSLLINQIIF